MADNSSGGGNRWNFNSGFSNFLANLSDLANIKKVSDIGIDFSLIGKKGRIAVSRKETNDEDQLDYSTFVPKEIQIQPSETPYFDKKYLQRVQYLNVFASHPEIEFITHTLTDEAIVYDEFGSFCNIQLSGSDFISRPQKITDKDPTKKTHKEELESAINKNFKRIYTLLGFNDGITAWAYFLQWLIEGWLAFEIIYDDPNATDGPKRISGFQEIRVDTLAAIDVDEEVKDSEGKIKKDKDGNSIFRKRRVWKQIVRKRDGTTVERTLADNSIIVIRYDRIPGNKGRISYVERLIRSFNLMRTMENTKVAWHVMNSQFRLKMIMPVGTKTTAKAKQALAVVTNKHKEDLFIDHNSGEVQINGQSKINFGRNIVLPSRNGATPDIEGISYNGPDLSNMDSVKYFERKLWRDSRLPFSRFDKENGSGTRILFNAEGIPHDELSFYKFVNRLRKEFEQIIKKPVYLQTILDYPELKLDLEFKSKLGIIYESNSLFEDAKKEELLKRKIENLRNDESMMEIDGTTPLYSRKFLYTKKYNLMTEEEWVANKEERDEELEEIQRRNTANNPVGLDFSTPPATPVTEPVADITATGTETTGTDDTTGNADDLIAM